MIQFRGPPLSPSVVALSTAAQTETLGFRRDMLVKTFGLNIRR